MILDYPNLPRRVSIQTKESRDQRIWSLLYASILLVTVGLSFLMIRRGPDYRVLAWILYFVGALVILYRPRWGVYLILFFALLSDAILLPWYPFIKNFSSEESIFFVSNAFIFSPMETYLVLTFLSWMGRKVFGRKVGFYRGNLFSPALIFLAFIVFGLIMGLVSGGNVTIALWEVRPFFYLFAMIVLCSNLLSQKEHFNHLIWFAVIAIVIKCIIGSIYFFSILGASVAGIESITDHAASLWIDSIFVFILLAWLYKASPVKKYALLAAVPLLLTTYLANQRRAAFVSLALAIILILVLLYMHNRPLFWIITPLVAIAAVIYLGAFWNNTGTIGMPARAVKSVIARDSASTRDQASDVYRILENYDTGYTIRQKPLTGVGFGNKFTVVIPLPDISFAYPWWNYFPHNSIIYIWLKTGVGGFIAMLYFVGISILTGVRAVLHTANVESKVILGTAVLYVVMHFLYAYVDISWDTQSMLYLGCAIGMINLAEVVLSLPNHPGKKRYPWQQEASPQPNWI